LEGRRRGPSESRLILRKFFRGLKENTFGSFSGCLTITCVFHLKQEIELEGFTQLKLRFSRTIFGVVAVTKYKVSKMVVSSLGQMQQQSSSLSYIYIYIISYHKHIYIYIISYAYIYAYLYIYIHMPTCMHACIHTNLQVHTYSYVRIIPKLMYVRMYFISKPFFASFSLFCQSPVRWNKLNGHSSYSYFSLRHLVG
jgi:hypothetical protein